MFLKLDSLVMAASILATAVIAVPHNIARQTSGLSLTAKLLLADSAADRYALLPNDSDYIYDFSKGPPALPSRKTFPALTGMGVSMAYAIIPACSLGPIHIHPRASELFLTVAGEIHGVHIPELGAGPATNGSTRVLNATLKPGQMALFPQGAFHTTWNPTCETATAAAAFGSDDEGIVPIISNLFSLDDAVLEDLVGGSLDAAHIKAVRDTLSTVQFSVKACKAKCGMN